MAKAMAESLVAKADSPERIELIFYVDENDPCVEQYREILASTKRMIAPERPISECYQRMFDFSDADVFFIANDDAIMQTKSWDSIVLERIADYPDGIFLAWFWDGIQGEKMACFPILSRRWIETLGYVVPPYFKTICADRWLTEIARKLGRCLYIPEVYFEHLHPSTGKRKQDDTYKRNRANGQKDHDSAAYRKHETMIDVDVDKLAMLMD